MTKDVELLKVLTDIKNDIDLDDTEKHAAMKAVMDEVKDRLCTVHVGDEVIKTSWNELQVITYIDRDKFGTIKSNGDTMSYYYDRSDLIKGNVVKTGKNYPQIVEVLKGLRGEGE